MDSTALLMLLKTCAPSVDSLTARALLSVESSFNPYAIAVVDGALERQPKTLGEAIATLDALSRDGWNYSVGLGQINKHNFDRYSLNHRNAFEPCANLKAMQGILSECFVRALKATTHEQEAIRFALSCYYSGNFKTGFKHGYVQKIENAARKLQTNEQASINVTQ